MDTTAYFQGIQMSGVLKTDVKAFFCHHNQLALYQHTKRAVKKGRKLTKKDDVDAAALEIALYLHDIGRVLPLDEMANFLEMEGVTISEEERKYPDILHGLVSACIAQTVFRVADEAVLQAIRLHSTLRPDPTRLEKMVFLADKLSWTADADRTLVQKIKKGVNRSLDKGILVYLEHLYRNHSEFTYYHPLSRQAYLYFKYKVHQIYTVKRKKKEVTR